MKKLLLSLVALMAAAVSASASIHPWYTAQGTVGQNADWEATSWMTSTPFSTTEASVEMYKDSIVVRSWCGVEGYDIALTLDENGDPVTLYQIQDGEVSNHNNSGYQYVNTGLTGDGEAACVAAYPTGGYGSAWASAEDGGGIVFFAYTYADEACSQYLACTYYCITWDVPVPLFTVKGTVGPDEDWEATSWMTSTPFSFTDVPVEVYQDSVVVRSWCGVEGYDIALTLDKNGDPVTLYQIQDGEVSNHNNSGYQYVNTGLTGDGEAACVAAYPTGGYGSATVSENEAGGLIFFAYTYADEACSQYLACTYYSITWDAPTNGIAPTIIGDNATATDAATYNVAGQRVGSSYKGIVIKNGKKYIQR